VMPRDPELDCPAASEQTPAPADEIVCPVCGAACDDRQCKVVCPRCHIVVMNCSEF